MALKKVVTYDNGTSSEYHKISNVILDSNDEGTRIFVTVNSYLNQEFREKNAPIETKNYSFDIKENEDYDTGIRQLAYNKLKDLDEWADAEDC